MLTSSAPPPPVGSTFSIRVPIVPEWRNVELVTSAVSNCLAAASVHAELRTVVAMVAAELLENAIKYGEWPTAPNAAARGELHVDGSGGEIAIDVSSPTSPTSRHYERLVDTLAWLATFPSPHAAYLARIQELLEKPAAAGESRMGILRIAFEGRCVVLARREPATGFLHVSAKIRRERVEG